MNQRAAYLRKALAQERLLLGRAEDRYAEATALASQTIKAATERRNLVNEAERLLQKKRDLLHSLCNTFLGNAAKFQHECSFESFKSMETHLDAECKIVESKLLEKRQNLSELLQRCQSLDNEGRKATPQLLDSMYGMCPAYQIFK